MSIPTVKEEVRNFVPSKIMRHLKPSLARYSTSSGKVLLRQDLRQDLDNVFEESCRQRIIHLAPEYDTLLSSDRAEARAGLPITPDLKCPKKESLRGAYIPMERFPIKRRWYAYNPTTNTYAERRDKR